jgi:hypothetical protein
LIDSGIIDSTGVLELLGFLEETYAIQITDEEVVPENLDAIGRVAKFVERKRGQRRVGRREKTPGSASALDRASALAAL